jgi:hypothetical protein
MKQIIKIGIQNDNIPIWLEEEKYCEITKQRIKDTIKELKDAL